jgi:hypothetical protein
MVRNAAGALAVSCALLLLLTLAQVQALHLLLLVCYTHFIE